MNDEQEKFLSRSAFAAAQGWSPSYVTKLSHQGRLVLCPEDEGLINVEATLAGLLASGNPGKAYVRRYHADVRTKKHVTDQIQPDVAADEKPPANADPKYWDAKARRENTLGKLAEIELAKQEGRLVDRIEVEQMAYASARMLRDVVLGLPTRLAPELATLTDAFQIEVRMRDELRQIFTDMAKMTADDLFRLTGETPPTRLARTEEGGGNAPRR